MTPDREEIEELWSRLVSGETLPPGDEQVVLEAMSADAALRDDLLEDEGTDGMIAALARGAGDAEAFARAFADRVAAERDGARFTEKVRRGLRDEKARAGRRGFLSRLRGVRDGGPSWRPALAAACLLGAVALVLALALSRPRTPAGTPPVETAIPAVERTAPPEPGRPGPEREEPAPRPERRPPPPVEPPMPGPGKTEAPPAPPPPAPPEAVPAPPPPAPPPTAVAVAGLERVRGEAWVSTESGRAPAGAGRGLVSGQGVETAGGEASVKYPDETRIDLRPGTAIRVTGPAGKSVRLDRGTIDAQVARQPAGQSVAFVTPHAEATVLGTRLTVTVTEEATRLEVAEGRVRLRRLSDGKAVDVAAGQFAVAAAGAEMSARPVPIDEILLLPAQARVAGGEWKVVRDDRAAGGQALEAVRAKTIVVGKADIRNRLSEYVEFSFNAEAGRDYWIWVRGCCTAAAERTRYDAVALEAFNARFARPSPWPELANAGAYPFNGYGRREGYLWTGGDIDDPPAGTGPQASISIRFLRPGRQVLRLHALEAPLRVDAVWLSTTRKTPPEPDLKGPGR